jgi:uncharacterized membrane protein
MRMTLLVHIVAGGLGLISGYVALYAAKGAPLHRKSGMLFVYVMVTTAITGMLISAVEGVAPAINVPSALLTFYLVITSLTTVRPPATGSRSVDIATMLMALGIGLTCFTLGVAAIARGGRGAGIAFPLFLFGVVALLASAGDLRMIRAGGVRGAPRLARHLWRMCFGLFIASIAFYLGRERLPEVLRMPAVRAAGVLLPIAAMSYWLWRIRARRSHRRFVPVGTPEAASLTQALP